MPHPSYERRRLRVRPVTELAAVTRNPVDPPAAPLAVEHPRDEFVLDGVLATKQVVVHLPRHRHEPVVGRLCAGLRHQRRALLAEPRQLPSGAEQDLEVATSRHRRSVPLNGDTHGMAWTALPLPLHRRGRRLAPSIHGGGIMRSRISAASVVAVAMLAVAALFHGSPGADATQGQAVVAGQENTATNQTIVRNTSMSTPLCPSPTIFHGLTGCGQVGSSGFGEVTGVVGRGPTGVHGWGITTGVFGEGNGTGYGVEGEQHADGIGVYGHVNSPHGAGVWGENEEGTGQGVVGSAVNGVGVEARSPDGTALAVLGKARFSSSGKATIAGTAASPKSFVVVPRVALTDKSLVLVTPQTTSAGVFVLGAVPNVADGKVKIMLNKAVTVSYPVAWFIIEKF